MGRFEPAHNNFRVKAALDFRMRCGRQKQFNGFAEIGQRLFYCAPLLAVAVGDEDIAQGLEGSRIRQNDQAFP